jgi:hypothetical protein
MTLVLKPGYSFDSDASTYIDAVETADGQALETGVRIAINDFVLGCKQDEIWDAIKASCILAGARTLDGALVPLTGGAPTNFNFVSGDYDRETGLVGDGSTKYLDSNRAVNATPSSNIHASVFQTTSQAQLNRQFFGAETGGAQIFQVSTGPVDTNGRAFGRQVSVEYNTAFSLIGISNTSIELTGRGAGINSVSTAAFVSATMSNNIFLFARNQNAPNGHINARLAFYSIGESLDLAALDTRVSNLMTAIGAAIP